MKNTPAKKQPTKSLIKTPSLQVQLAAYLKEQKGTKTYAQFAKEIGVTEMVAFRILQGKHNTKLLLVTQIASKLGVKPSDIFKG